MLLIFLGAPEIDLVCQDLTVALPVSHRLEKGGTQQRSERAGLNAITRSGSNIWYAKNKINAEMPKIMIMMMEKKTFQTSSPVLSLFIHTHTSGASGTGEQRGKYA